MTAYFDEMARQISHEQEICGDDEGQFLEQVASIEAQLYRDVTAITGDREFPDDLREQMLGVLATQCVYQPHNLPVPERARERALRCGYSWAAEDMHDLFHDLARRGVATRFGRWNDDPSYCKVLRDEHDAEPSGTTFAFWPYDLFPYLLGGETSAEHPRAAALKDGLVYVPSYQGTFRPLFTLEGEHGKRMLTELRRLRNEYDEARRSHHVGCAEALISFLHAQGLPAPVEVADGHVRTKRNEEEG